MQAIGEVDGTVESVREEGTTVMEALMWGAVMAVVIVAIGAGLELLGADVIAFIRTQVGI